MKNNTFLRIISLVRPYKGRVALSILFAMLFAASSGATLAMILPIFDDILGANPGEATTHDLGYAMSATVVPKIGSAWNSLARGDFSSAAGHTADIPGAFLQGIGLASPRQALLAVIITMVSMILIKNLSCFLQSFFVASVEEGMLRDLRLRVYSHLLRLDLGYFAKSRSGELTSRLTADVVRIKGTVTQSLISSVREILLLVVYFSLALWVSWKLTLVTLAVLPPQHGPYHHAGKEPQAEKPQGPAENGGFRQLPHGNHHRGPCGKGIRHGDL